MVNVYSVKLTARLMTWLSSTKVLGLLFVIVVGIWKLIEQGTFPEDSRQPFEGSRFHPSEIALSFYGIMWAYEGWAVGVIVQEEIKSIKAIIWMSLISMPIAIVIYMLTNAAFFAVLSYDQVLNTKAVGLVFGQAVFGKAGIVIFCLIAIILTFGTSHASLFHTSRELFVTAREGSMPQCFSGIHNTFRTPLLAILLESLLIALFVVIGNIDSLISIFNATLWFWYGSAILGLVIMRITLPHKPRPFKVLLLFPCIMVVVSILLVVLPLWQDPVPQLLGFAGVLAGFPVYVLFVMEKPCRLKPRLLDRVGLWLNSITSKMFNTEIADAFDSYN